MTTLGVNGLLQRRLGDQDKAEELLLKALELGPSDPGLLTALGYLNLERYQRGMGSDYLDKAIVYSDQALEIEPDYWKTPFTRAFIAFGAGDAPRSIELYRRAIQLQPDNSQAYSNLSAAEMCMDQFQAAKNTILAMQAQLNNDALLLGNLGVANIELGLYAEAARQLREAIDVQKGGGATLYQLWSNYADALRLSGDKAGAIDAYNQALDILDRIVIDGGEHPTDRVARVLFQAIKIALQDEPGSQLRIPGLKPFCKRSRRKTKGPGLFSLHTWLLRGLHWARQTGHKT